MVDIKGISVALCMVLVTVFCSVAQSQDYPVKGEPCPNFTLDPVEYHKKKSVSLSDFQGKWLILYFWTTGCPAAVGGIKGMNEIQSEFGDRLQVLLIGKFDQRNRNIREIYEKFRAQYNFKLPIAYEVKLFERFVGDAAIPHVVVIKPDGIVYAITEGFEMTPDAISDLLQGKPKAFRPKNNAYDAVGKPRVKLSDPLLVNGNGGEETDFIYRSLLAKCPRDYPTLTSISLSEQLEIGRFQCIGLSIPRLYKYAYIGQGYWGRLDSLYGRFSKEVILEVREPEQLKIDWSSGAGRYNYSVTVPKEKATVSYVQQVMRHDLDNYFGYDVCIEEREVPVWKLVVKYPQRLKFADPVEKETAYVDHATIDISSGRTQLLVRIISVRNQSLVLVDSTKLDRNIRVKIDGDLANFEHVRKEMRKNGLDIVKDYMRMKVLVIRDPA